MRGRIRKTEGSAAIPTRFSKTEIARMERARTLLGISSRSAFIRQAVLGRLEELESEGILQVRDVTEDEAARLIDAYLKKHPGSHYVSDFVEALGLEPRTAFAAAQRLIDRGRVRVGRG